MESWEILNFQPSGKIGWESLDWIEKIEFLFSSRSNGFLLKLNPRNKDDGEIDGIRIKEDEENLIFSDLMQKMKNWDCLGKKMEE